MLGGFGVFVETSSFASGFEKHVSAVPHERILIRVMQR